MGLEMAYLEGSAVNWIVVDKENQLRLRTSSWKELKSAICRQFDVVDPRVAGYDKLATMQFMPGSSVLSHLKDIRGVFRDIGGLDDFEKLRLYSRTVLADLQWHALGYQQSNGTFDKLSNELAM